MNPPADLELLYGEWRRLACAEREAIQAGAWEQVIELQTAKDLLKPAVLTASEPFESGPAPGGTRRAAVPSPVRRALEDLIGFESQNQALISIALEHARLERNDLEGSARNLRRIHRSYRCASAPGWERFS